MERTEAGAGDFARVHRLFEGIPSWHALIAQCGPYPCTVSTPQMQLYARPTSEQHTVQIVLTAYLRRLSSLVARAAYKIRSRIVLPLPIVALSTPIHAYHLCAAAPVVHGLLCPRTALPPFIGCGAWQGPSRECPQRDEAGSAVRTQSVKCCCRDGHIYADYGLGGRLDCLPWAASWTVLVPLYHRRRCAGDMGRRERPSRLG